MAVNLFELAKGALGDQLMGQIANDLGESPEVTGKAVNAGIPAILGGLMGKANSSGGMDEIFNAVKDDDGGLLGDLAGSLLGGGQSGLLAKGAGILSMVLGARQGGVLGTLASLAGMRNSSGAGKLLGMLAPVVMGVIGKQRAANNLDASGVKNMLLGQKDSLAGLLPNEMRDSLGIADMYDDGPRAATATASTATTQVREETPVKKGGFNIVPWLIAGALAFLAWTFWPKSEPETVRSVDTQVEVVEPAEVVEPMETETVEAVETVQAVESAQVTGDGFDIISEQLTSRFGGITDGLNSITDVGSAQGVVSQITETGDYLSALNLDGMNDTTRSALGSVAQPLMENVEGAVESAYAIPGVQSVIEPALSPIMDMLKGL